MTVCALTDDETTQALGGVGGGGRHYDSPLSRSMTAFGVGVDGSDPFSVAADAAVAALPGLAADLEGLQQQQTAAEAAAAAASAGGAAGGTASDTEDSAPAESGYGR